MLNFPTYDKELYALIRLLQTWKDYLWTKEFKLNKVHVKWVEFIESFAYGICYKEGKENVGINALSHMYTLLPTLKTKLLGFEQVKTYYESDPDFKEVFKTCEKFHVDKHYRLDDFLFYENMLCVPNCSLIDLFIRKAHGRDMMGHFGVAKTMSRLHDLFLLATHEEGCGENLCQGFNTPLPIPTELWTDVYMEFVLGLPRTRKGCDSIFVVVDKFSKMAHFIHYHKTDVSFIVAELFFIEIFSEQVNLDGKQRDDLVKKMQAQARLNIEKKTKRYPNHANKGRQEVIFEPGEMVWIHFMKDMFPNKRKFKLLPRTDDPFKVLKNINNNTYKIKLPSKYNVS
ncbi:hypothetical protein N665_0101s0024 [Sinapis alba]|nr:hypothetical protein N665_0101s0024 [Sinapis alba]